MKIENPEQEEPERNIFNRVHGLLQAERQGKRPGQAQSIEKEDGKRSEGKTSHPEKQRVLAVANPGQQTEERDEGVETVKRKGELAAAQPAVIERSLVGGDGFGAADFWRRKKASLVASVVGEVGRLPDADGEDVGVIAQRNAVGRSVQGNGQSEGLRGLVVVPHRTRRHAAIGADEHAVPVKLVSIVNMADEESNLRIGSRSGRESEVAAIPGITGVALMAGLRTPRFGCGDPVPAGVVEQGRTPGLVVAGVELPGPIDGHGARADRLQMQNRGGIRRQRGRGNGANGDRLRARQRCYDSQREQR